MTTADTLSHTPTPLSTTSDQAVLTEVTAFIAVVTNALPAADQHLTEIRVKQKENEVCSTIRTYCTIGWPNINLLHLPIPLKVHVYWTHRGELNVNDNALLLCGQCHVIPACLCVQVLKQLHVSRTELIVHLNCLLYSQFLGKYPAFSFENS